MNQILDFSTILASQNPSKTLLKSYQNRCPKKHVIFHRCWLENTSVARVPTRFFVLVFPILFACRTLFFTSVFSCIFGPKNLPKTLPKRGPNPLKIDAKNMLFFNIDFFRFWHRFWSLLGFQVGAKLAILASKLYDVAPFEPS